jgi:hypothetical protein
MLKETVTYTDYFGEEQTEDIYFHLSKAELLEIEMLADGGSFSDMLLQIIESKDNALILKLFKNIVLLSYGIRSEDGRRFIKNEQLREEFTQTAAYSEVFISLAMDAEKAARFVNGIMPADLIPDKPQIDVVDSEGKGQTIALTQENLAKMSHEEIAALIRQVRNQQ